MLIKGGFRFWRRIGDAQIAYEDKSLKSPPAFIDNILQKIIVNKPQQEFYRLLIIIH